MKFEHVEFGHPKYSVHRTLDGPGLVANVGRHSFAVYSTFVDRWQDSLYHYSTVVGIRNRPELYWRCFAYEILRWPDGIKPSNYKDGL